MMPLRRNADLKTLWPKVPRHRPDEGDNGWLKEGNEALGCIIAKKYGRQFKQGVVTGFVPEGFEEDGDVQQMDLWHVEIDDGDSEDFEAHELEACRDTHNRSFRRYTNMAQGDKMHDYRECRNEVYNQFGGTGRRDLEQAGYSAAQWMICSISRLPWGISFSKHPSRWRGVGAWVLAAACALPGRLSI